MAGFITNALSGLIAAQRSLQTTSSNIANANTEGYTRQRVVQVQGPVLGSGSLQFGYGTQVKGVERIYDQLIANQLTAAKTGEQRSQIINQYALRLEGYLGSTDTGIASSLQSFYTQINAVASDPTSSVNRQQLLAEAEALGQRFRQLGSQLDSVEREINQRLTSVTQAVNNDLRAIADLNGKIVTDGSGVASALLDERQILIDRVAEKVDIQTIAQPDGGVNLMMNNGQPLVLGLNTFQLGVQQDEFDPQRLQLTHSDGTTTNVVSRKVTGGELGGLLSFREEMLDPARRDMGRIALGVTDTFNRQNNQGLDINGNLGVDMFASFAPEVQPSSGNAGTGAVTATFGDLSAVEARDYKLRYDGGGWNLTDTASGAPVAMAGSGTGGDPFIVDGMEIVVSGAPSLGDEFRLSPVSYAAARVSVSMTDASQIAAAAPMTSRVQLTNLGDATIGSVQVTDVDNPDVLQTAAIVFDDPPNTYRVYSSAGIAGPIAYVSGSSISQNGWTVEISGSPQANDTFVLEQTSPGSGDNTNANALAQQFTSGFFAQGTVSVQELSAQLSTSVGSYVARSSADLSVQSTLREQFALDLESVSGVNLEEEAVNMLRYQEAYLAASKMISVSNDLFQSIINAIR